MARRRSICQVARYRTGGGGTMKRAAARQLLPFYCALRSRLQPRVVWRSSFPMTS